MKRIKLLYLIAILLLNSNIVIAQQKPQRALDLATVLGIDQQQLFTLRKIMEQDVLGVVRVLKDTTINSGVRKYQLQLLRDKKMIRLDSLLGPAKTAHLIELQKVTATEQGKFRNTNNPVIK